MAGALFVTPYPEFDTIDGIPLVNGSLSFLVDGEPSRVWSHQAIITAGDFKEGHRVPTLGSYVQLNATGRLQGDGGAPVNIWVDPLVAYDITVKASDGSTVWSVPGYRQPDPSPLIPQSQSVRTNPTVLTPVYGVHRFEPPTAAMLCALTEPTDVEEGIELHLQAATAFAHVVLITSGIAGNGAGVDTATFGGAIGDGITLIAVDGFWHLVASRNVVLS